MTIQTQRSITMPGIWAKNAATTIPNPPIPGQAYRNPALDKATIEAGQAYSSRADSAQWNQWNYSCSVLESEIERYGVLPYCPLTTYPVNGLCLGDGAIYQAVQENGPGTTIGPVQPGNDAVWKVIVNPSEAFLKFTYIDETEKQIYVDSVNGVDEPGRGETLQTAYKSLFYAFLRSTEKYIPRRRAIGFCLAVGGTYTQGGTFYMDCLHTGERGFFLYGSDPAQRVPFTSGFAARYTPCDIYYLKVSGYVFPEYICNVLGQRNLLRVISCEIITGPNEISIFSDAGCLLTLQNTNISLNNALYSLYANYSSIFFIESGNSINGTLTNVGYTGIITNMSQIIKSGAATGISGTVTGGISRLSLQGLSLGVLYSPNFIPGVGAPTTSTGSIYI